MSNRRTRLSFNLLALLFVLGFVPLTIGNADDNLTSAKEETAKLEVADAAAAPENDAESIAQEASDAGPQSKQTQSSTAESAVKPRDIPRKRINIGVLAHKGAEAAMKRWGGLGDYLTSAIPGHEFVMVPLDWDQMRGAVISAKVDFMLSNPGMYVEYEFLYNVRSLATLKNLRMGEAYTKFGSIIFRRKDRTDIQSVQDLADKRFAAVNENAWGGWRVGWRQMLELDFDPYRELGQLTFTKSHDNVIRAVLNGDVDAGTVRTDALEGLAAKDDAINIDDFELIYRNTAYGDRFPFLLSTRLYPEWAFSAAAHANEDLAEQVSIALLNMPADHPTAKTGDYAGWTIPENYQPVHETFKMLGVTPYEDYQSITFDMVLRKYGGVLAIGGIIGLLLLLSLAGYFYYLGRKAIREEEEADERGEAEPTSFWLEKFPGFASITLRSLPLVLVTAFSLLLLIYVSYGESRRTYEKHQLNRIAAESEISKSLIEEFLSEGLPFTFITPLLEENLALGKLAGFRISRGDESSEYPPNTLTLYDSEGNLVYSNSDIPAPLEQGEAGARVENLRYDTSKRGHIYRMVLPLEQVQADEEADPNRLGTMIVNAHEDAIVGPIEKKFEPIFHTALILLAVFSLFILLLEARVGRGKDKLEKYLFAITFTLMAGFVMQTLYGIYEEGAEMKTKAIAQTLSERLTAISDTGADFTEVEGLGRLFSEFQNKDPEISIISLLINNNVLIHPNPKMVGFAWEPSLKDYEHLESLDADNRAKLVVVMPWEVVRDKILRSIKNFSSLFISCGLIVFIFLNAAASIRDIGTQRLAQTPEGGEKPAMSAHSALWLNMIVVVWFLSIFAEGLNASFIPQFLSASVTADNIPQNYASVLFAAFFAAFVATLVPAGRYAERHEIKNLLIAGAGCIALGLVMMSLTTDFFVLLAARIVGGIGQGLAFIGVQAFIFAVSPPGKQSQGASKLILGRNAGIISGSAIGALLVVYSSTTDMFLLGAVLAGITGIFTILMIPKVGSKAQKPVTESTETEEEEKDEAVKDTRPVAEEKPKPRRGSWLADLEFMRTALFIGMAGKIIYNGVVFYSVPIIMSKLNYAQEDIGQALMIFAISTMVTNSFGPRMADRSGNAAFVLFIGAMTLGFGAMLIGLSDWAANYAQVVPHIDQFALFGGLMVLGLGNGFVAAPVVGHILKTESAKKYGQSYIMSIFRVLERSGHIVGPILIGQLLIFTNTDTAVIAMIGVAMIVLGLTFFFFSKLRQGDKPVRKSA